MSMVFCRGCGKEIHETAVTCPSCGAPQNTPTTPEKGKVIYTSYDQVPWYRKEWFTWLCFFICTPALAVLLLTGESYYTRKGQLKTVSKGLKIFFIIAGIVWLLQIPAMIAKDEKGVIEKSACPLVTQIIHEQFKKTATCKIVKVTQDLGNGLYKAEATLDNGNDIKITVERKGDNIEVTIPPQ